MREWLPEAHLAYFIMEVVGELDLRSIYCKYDGRQGGNPAFHPQMMVALLIYAYCVGLPSSRKIEKAAMSLISRWAGRWRKAYPAAVRCLEKDTDRLLHYLKCPPEHHKAIRTSNHIERQFKEVRRRMRPMEITPNQASTDRVLYSTIMIRNEKLREYPLTFTQNLLH